MPPGSCMQGLHAPYNTQDDHDDDGDDTDDI